MHTVTHPLTPPVAVLTGLGQALRWLRERQARKQYQVAAAAGITKGMLSAYETGRQRPSLETLDKLLETLGCDLNDLHNALQIVNGRPEQMKGWRGGGLGVPPSLLETPTQTTPTTPTTAWPEDPGPGIPAYGAYGSAIAPLHSEVQEPPRRRTITDLHQILGLFGDQQSPALQSPALPPEEELALAQMLEGFHNLIRYWHRCLAALAATGQAKPPSPASPTDPPAGQPPPTVRPKDPRPAAPQRSSSR